MELAPVAPLQPGPALLGVLPLGVAHLSMEHPVVEIVEGLRGVAHPEVVAPPADDGVQPFHHGGNTLTVEREPLFPQTVPECLDARPTGLDQQDLAAFPPA